MRSNRATDGIALFMIIFGILLAIAANLQTVSLSILLPYFILIFSGGAMLAYHALNLHEPALGYDVLAFLGGLTSFIPINLLPESSLRGSLVYLPSLVAIGAVVVSLKQRRQKTETGFSLVWSGLALALFSLGIYLFGIFVLPSEK